MAKVIIIDTSILNVWLKVPGKETSGKKNEFDFEYVDSYIKNEIKNGSKLVLPMTSVIETGNHIAHSGGRRMNSANELKSIIEKVAEGKAPWLAFDQQNQLWEKNKLKELAAQWIVGVEKEEQSIGDTAIVEVAKHYASAGFEVEIFTGDGGLKNYEYKITGQQGKLRRNRKQI